MNKRTYYTLCSLLGAMLIVFGCHKEPALDCPPDLPCATQTGENTFGCYINGKPWVAKVEPYVLDPSAHKLVASYDENDYGSFNNNFFAVTGAYYGDSLSSLIIAFHPLTHQGNIFLAELELFRLRYRTPTAVFDIDSMSNYKIEITRIDTVLNIIAGKFEFTGISTNDTIVVSDGRFDVKYYPE